MADLHPDAPELFDLDYGDVAEDLPFYKSLAERCERPILELGVGTGRVAIPLARSGFDVWGIDISEAMLERARCKAGPALGKRLRLELGDMRDFQLGCDFDLIFAGLGGFHHLLTAGDQVSCLRSVQRHLAPGGLLVCDLRALLAADWETGAGVPLLHDWTRVLPGSGETVMKFRSVRAGPARQVQHTTNIYEVLSNDGTVRRVINAVDLRFITRYEMEGLLREAGLQLDQTYGDFDLSPYDDSSELLITVARKPVPPARRRGVRDTQ